MNRRFVPLLFLVLALAGAAMCFVVFGRSLQHGFVADDWAFIHGAAQAPTFQAMLALLRFDRGWFVRPTQWLVTWGLFRTFGPDPLPYHAASVVLHAINTLLLGRLAFMLLRAQRASAWNVPLAAAGAVLFASNWRHHEAIFWYAAISEPLALCFRLSALLLAWHALQQQTPQRRAWTSAALGAGALALASKENAIVLPLDIALLAAYGVATQRTMPMRAALTTLPFALLAGAWLGSYAAAAATGAGNALNRSEFTLVPFDPWGWLLRGVQHVDALFIGRALPLLGVQLVAMIVLVGLACWRRRALWVYAWGWLIAALLPHIALTAREAVRLDVPLVAHGIGGDRYLYAASAGAAVLLLSSASWLVDEVKRAGRRPLLVVAIGTVLLGCGFWGWNLRYLVRWERDWRAASVISMEIVDQIQTVLPIPPPNAVLCVADLPDTYGRAYVFRNGMAEALWLAYARTDLLVRVTVQQPPSYAPQREPPILDETGCTIVLRYDAGTGQLAERVTHNE